MNRQFELMILVNVLIGILFLLPILWLGSRISYMDLFIMTVRGTGFDSTFYTNHPNYVFWLFWLSTAVNLYFIFRLQRSKETKQNHSQIPNATSKAEKRLKPQLPDVSNSEKMMMIMMMTEQIAQLVIF